MSSVTDTFHRPLRDLRISVTERCNFRCTYCMPKEVFGPGFAFLPHREVLTFEEILQLSRICVAHGVDKIRITGGEPLLRQDIEKLVAMLASIAGLKDLTLTTNGSLLPKKARALKAAGLQRITVSLDSLRDDVFMAMNDVRYPVQGVLDGIQAAVEAGLHPIKINMVVKRGSNDGDILEMARYFRGQGHILRFIEYMDVGTTNGWRIDEVVPAAEVIRMIDAEMPLEPQESNYLGEVANRYRYKDGSGEIGVIASVTQPFCRDCTRARLSAEGKLYTCLFSNVGHDFKGLLRGGKSDAEIAAFLRSIWRIRDDRYSERRSEETGLPTGPAYLPTGQAGRTGRQAGDLPKVEMSHIGG